MKKANKNNSVGRPSSYKPEYNELVYKLCLLGATDKEIANILHVNELTINRWKKSEPEFCKSLKSGKEIADTNVAESLYNRALGYSHPEDKIFNNNGEALIVKTIKHYPPDTTAAIFWLKNRQPDKWRDRKEFTGKGGEPIEHKVDHAINSDTATTIFDILEKSGALSAISDDTKDDKVHTTQAD